MVILVFHATNSITMPENSTDAFQFIKIAKWCYRIESIFHFSTELNKIKILIEMINQNSYIHYPQHTYEYMDYINVVLGHKSICQHTTNGFGLYDFNLVNKTQLQNRMQIFVYVVWADNERSLIIHLLLRIVSILKVPQFGPSATIPTHAPEVWTISKSFLFLFF